MTFIRLVGAEIMITSGPTVNDEKQLMKLSSEISKFRSDNVFTDIRIICTDGSSLWAHKAILAKRSKWIVKLTEALTENYACIMCPDFSAMAVSKVLELLYSGVTFIPKEMSPDIYLEICDVIKDFGFQVK